MVKHAPVGIVLVDADGRVVHANPKAESIFGYERREIVDQPLEILLPERFRKVHESHRQGFGDNPQPRPMGEGRHLFARHKSGREIPVEIGLVPVETSSGRVVLASIVDITAQKDAMKSLARLAAVVEASEDAIVTLSPEGNIMSWNNGAEKIFGYRTEEILGKNVAMLYPPDRMEEFRFILERIRDGEAARHVESVRLRKDGRPVHVVLSLAPLRDSEGRIIGASTISHDVTEKKRLEQDLLHAVELEQKRIGQDLHDTLGQQLLAISFLGNILRKKLTSKSIPEASEAAHIEELLNQTKLNLRKLTRGLYAADLEARGLGASLKDLVEQVRESSAILCEFEGDETLRVPDRSLSENLYRLAQEAVNNAVKHSLASKIVVSLRQQNQQVALLIDDNGIGVPDSALRGGAGGLGLRTMQFRANVIGGSLDIGRRAEGGTVVRCTVLLP
ncbi:MAG TPA: PAS domain S-box protein [Elusimicrobiota bacterium]|nr:PAS domain S-box protein [Elusimicrobiota bacterium]